MEKPPETFSGGYQVRLNLAKVLVSHPNLLLLDEPTNYLDIVSLRWIVKFLREWKHELMIIFTRPRVYGQHNDAHSHYPSPAYPQDAG
jgi:ATPase subunit of ABC transporter with duplicated ATPase domains